MKEELNIYWEDCIIGDEQKKDLIIKYISMFEDAFKTSNFLKENKYYSWSIISSYYSMYYMALIILAKNHNLKPKSYDSHSQVIIALHFFYPKKEIVKLMNIAFNKVNFEEIPGNLLYKGKVIRNKINYSMNFNLEFTSKEMEDFTINTRDKFIEIINNLLECEKNDN